MIERYCFVFIFIDRSELAVEEIAYCKNGMGLLPLYRILLQELLHQVLVGGNIHHILLGAADLEPVDYDVDPVYQAKFLAGIAVVLQFHVVETRAGVAATNSFSGREAHVAKGGRRRSVGGFCRVEGGEIDFVLLHDQALVRLVYDLEKFAPDILIDILAYLDRQDFGG